MRINSKIIKREAISLQHNHIPELQPTWSLQKYTVSSAQRHGHGYHFESGVNKVEEENWFGMLLLRMSYCSRTFQVEDGLIMNSQSYCKFLEDLSSSGIGRVVPCFH